MTYRVTKRYGHNLGFSACFRQWRADSHCHHLHGYALAFELVFECETLDDRNWVIDFGSLRSLKKAIEAAFDHVLLVAEDDPEIETIKALHELGIANVLVVPAVGCEMFAKMVYDYAHHLVSIMAGHRDVKLISVTCSEHEANSATYVP